MLERLRSGGIGWTLLGPSPAAARAILSSLGIRSAALSRRRLAIKQHYGIRSEKLAEFGLQPFRGRIRKAKPVVESQKTADVDATPATD